MSNDGKDLEPGRGEISPADREAFRRRAADLGKRLEGIQQRRVPIQNAAQRSNALGQAVKIMVELLVGVAVGGFIGWVLDGYLGSRPWLLVLFVVLGFAAGVLNMVRSAKRMQRMVEPAQRAAPSVRDDDEK